MVLRGTQVGPATRLAARLTIGLVAGVVGLGVLLGSGAAPASAATVDQVTITGIALAEPLEVPAEEYPDLCATLYREVSWLVRKRPDADEPDPDTLGPQYTLEANVDGEPRHRFHLYPLAEGGPRVFRPAEQPGEREVREGWFHGRLSLPETLAAAGIPVHDDPTAPGGSGGGLTPETEAPERGLFAFLEDWREGMKLVVAVTLAIVVGLAGAALLIRRRV